MSRETPLADCIEQLGTYTGEVIKDMEMILNLFTLDNVSDGDLKSIINIMKIKSLRIRDPRNIDDINNNLRKKKVIDEWPTYRDYNICSNQQEL